MLAGLRGPVVAGFAQLLQNIAVPTAECAGQEMRSPDLPGGFANWVGRAVKLSPGDGVDLHEDHFLGAAKGALHPFPVWSF